MLPTRGQCVGGWGASTFRLLPKFNQYLCNRKTSTRGHLQNNTFILRKVLENHYDMAYQKYCKIVVSKEVCLHYVTLTLSFHLNTIVCCTERKDKLQYKFIKVTLNDLKILPDLPWIRAELISVSSKGEILVLF